MNLGHRHGSILKNNMSNEKDLFDDSNFGEDSEASSNTVNWGKVGDFLAGTFVKARHNVETQFGVNSIYEFIVERGQFHKLQGKGRSARPVDEPTVLNKGENWSVWGRNEVFNGVLNSLRPGQVVKIMYSEDKDTQMGTAKIVKVYTPKNNDGSPLMNAAWLEAQSPTAADF